MKRRKRKPQSVISLESLKQELGALIIFGTILLAVYVVYRGM